MLFKYSAKNPEGKLEAGYIESANKEAAISRLQTLGLYVLSLEEAGKKPWYYSLVLFFNRVKEKDKVIFTRQLSTLLSAHIAIDRAINSLANQTENPILRSTLKEISSEIREGFSFSQALSHHPDIFDDFYVNMIRSAEISGRIEEATEYLADYLERQQSLKKRILSSLIYPIFIVVLFFIVVIIATVVIMPQLNQIFEETKVPLPLMTRIFLGLGNLIIHWGWSILILLIILAFLFWRYFQTEEGKTVLDELKLKIPIISRLLKKIYVTRFAEASSVLIKGGIATPTALEMAGKVTANYVYRNIAFEIAEGVRRGSNISTNLGKYPDYFPPLVAEMVAVGEASGNLDSLLRKVADFYKEETEMNLGIISELIQPVVIVILAVSIGLLVASILFPIYNLIQSI